MTEFEAFLCGLIMGEGSTRQPNRTGGPKQNRNIALQDVAFCQCLRNIIESLEKYVQTSHPTPEEFIRHILPKTNFEQPYTTEEAAKIKRHEGDVKDYIEWINTKIKTKTLIGGDNWESLGALRMIWQDEVYTPDFDHLDLLFGDKLLSKPVKCNGRLYEYNGPFYLEGLAKNFFNSVPARIIEGLCIECSQEILKKYGYDYDGRRFDYNIHADKAGTMDTWRKESRHKAYKLLLKDMPSFCKATWSSYTVAIKNMENYRLSERKAISKEEEKRRKVEASQVCTKLTLDERNEYAVDTIKTTFDSSALIGLIPICTIGIVIILAAISGFVSEDVQDILTKILLACLGVGVVAFLSVLLYSMHPNKKYGGVDKKVYDYITVLQAAYYDKTNEECARKYEELLQRVYVDKVQPT